MSATAGPPHLPINLQASHSRAGRRTAMTPEPCPLPRLLQKSHQSFTPGHFHTSLPTEPPHPGHQAPTSLDSGDGQTHPTVQAPSSPAPRAASETADAGPRARPGLSAPLDAPSPRVARPPRQLPPRTFQYRQTPGLRDGYKPLPRQGRPFAKPLCQPAPPPLPSLPVTPSARRPFLARLEPFAPPVPSPLPTAPLDGLYGLPLRRVPFREGFAPALGGDDPPLRHSAGAQTAGAQTAAGSSTGRQPPDRSADFWKRLEGHRTGQQALTELRIDTLHSQMQELDSTSDSGQTWNQATSRCGARGSLQT